MSIKDNDDFKIVLEHYPRVALAIELHWGSRDFDKVMDKFLHDTRDGTRQGFPALVGGATLQYVPKDIQSHTYKDYDGSSDTDYFINCPPCGERVFVKRY